MQRDIWQSMHRDIWQSIHRNIWKSMHRDIYTAEYAPWHLAENALWHLAENAFSSRYERWFIPSPSIRQRYWDKVTHSFLHSYCRACWQCCAQVLCGEWWLQADPSVSDTCFPLLSCAGLTCSILQVLDSAVCKAGKRWNSYKCIIVAAHIYGWLKLCPEEKNLSISLHCNKNIAILGT